MVENNIKNEEKIEIVANTRSKSYAQNMSYEKNIDLAKIYNELSSQDEKFLKIPENINVSIWIQGYFCSDTVFNLCKKVLSETAIRVLEKGLYFAPIQNNEPELGKDF